MKNPIRKVGNALLGRKTPAAEESAPKADDPKVESGPRDNTAQLGEAAAKLAAALTKKPAEPRVSISRDPVLARAKDRAGRTVAERLGDLTKAEKTEPSPPVPGDAPPNETDKAGTPMPAETDINKEQPMSIDISKLQDITGFIGACLVDSDSGMMLASLGGGALLDMETAGAANTEVVKAKLRAMKALGLDDAIEDILISLGKQYHLIRPLAKNPTIFLYVALDRKVANLALARSAVRNVEGGLSVA